MAGIEQEEPRQGTEARRKWLTERLMQIDLEIAKHIESHAAFHEEKKEKLQADFKATEETVEEETVKFMNDILIPDVENTEVLDKFHTARISMPKLDQARNSHIKLQRAAKLDRKRIAELKQQRKAVIRELDDYAVNDSVEELIRAWEILADSPRSLQETFSRAHKAFDFLWNQLDKGNLQSILRNKGVPLPCVELFQLHFDSNDSNSFIRIIHNITKSRITDNPWLNAQGLFEYEKQLQLEFLSSDDFR